MYLYRLKHFFTIQFIFGFYNQISCFAIRICIKNFLESACLVIDQEFVFFLTSSLPLLFLLSFLLLLHLDLFLLRYRLPLPLLEGIAFRLFLPFYLFVLCSLLEIYYSLWFFNVLLFLLLNVYVFVLC